MSTWLKLLPMELDSIQNIIEPDHPIEKNDNVVGQMSETAKKLFTLGRLLEKDASQNALDSHYCTDKAQKLEREAKAGEYAAKAQAVKLLMWIGIRDELRLWGEDVGVRSGFVVVVTKADNNDIPPFLKRLFGGEL